MERVEIQLYVLGNEGEPAGATFCDPTGSDLSCAQALTKEALSGYGTSAEIDGATLWKAGGYTVCAKALPGGGAAGFTFQEVCAPMIHIKN